MTTKTPRTDAMFYALYNKRGDLGEDFMVLARKLELELAACYDRRLFLSDENAAKDATITRLRKALEPIDRWFREGNAPIHPGALLGDDDRSIAETVRDALAKSVQS